MGPYNHWRFKIETTEWHLQGVQAHTFRLRSTKKAITHGVKIGIEMSLAATS